MSTREFAAPVVPCQRRTVVQWAAAGILLPALPTWTGAAQAQISLSGAINYAGWFRALSQRLAKNYFLSAAKVESKVVQAQLSSDTADFRQALLTLKAAPVFTPAIRNELELADAQWLLFDAALRRPVYAALREVLG